MRLCSNYRRQRMCKIRGVYVDIWHDIGDLALVMTIPHRMWNFRVECIFICSCYSSHTFHAEKLSTEYVRYMCRYMYRICTVIYTVVAIINACWSSHTSFKCPSNVNQIAYHKIVNHKITRKNPLKVVIELTFIRIFKTLIKSLCARAGGG